MEQCVCRPKADAARHLANLLRLPSNQLTPAQRARTATTANPCARMQVLTSQLRHSNSWEELQALFLEHRARMNHIHLSALMVRLAQLADEAGSGCGRHQSSSSSSSSSGSSGRRGAVSGPGEAGLESPGQSGRGREGGSKLQALVRMRPFLAQLVPHVGMQLLTLGPRQLSNVMWALGR